MGASPPWQSAPSKKGGSLRYVASLISAIAFIALFAGSALAQTSLPVAVELFAEGGGSFMTSGAWQQTVPLAICTPTQTVVCPAVAGPYATANMTSSFSKTGRFALGARTRFTRHDAIEASFSYSFNHLFLRASGVNPTTGQPFTESGSSFNRLQLVTFNYVRYFLIRSRLQPFATAGLGSDHFKGPLSASAPAEGLIGGGDHFQLVWNFGGGADLRLRRHLALQFDMRDYMVSQPLPIRGTAQSITPSLGLVYRFQ